MSTTTAKRGGKTKFLALTASLSMLVAGLVGVAVAAPASATEQPKEYICHSTSQKGVGSATNPYVLINVNTSSIDEWLEEAVNGHGGHGPDRVFDPTQTKFEQGKWGDIIPPFTYVVGEGEDAVEVKYPGLNWKDGQAIWENNCDIPGYEPPADPTAGATATCEASLTATVDAKGYDPKDLEVIVTVDGSVVPDAGIWTEKTFSYSQTLTDTLAHSITVDVFAGSGENRTKVATDTASNADCTPRVLTCVDRGDCPQDPPPVVVTEEAEPVAVVEAAVVEAPAAPVAAAPAPAVVSVPAAATVPAAVPAGGGSQAPGLPMWALALVVVGAIGAAAAGKQILGARN